MEPSELIKPQTINASIKDCQYAKTVIGGCSDCLDRGTEDCPYRQ